MRSVIFASDATTNAEALQGPLVFPPPNDIADLLVTSPEKRDEKEKEKLFAYFKSVAPETAEARKHLADARKAKDDFEEPRFRAAWYPSPTPSREWCACCRAEIF